MKQAIISVIVMLTVAPLVTCSTLVCLEPSRWGGSFNPFTIVGMAMFGIITTPLWPTYIPAMVITPLLMKVVARTRFFRKAPLPILTGIAVPIGGLLGSLVQVRVILLNLKEPKHAIIWAVSGAVAGSITLCFIVLIYRYRWGDDG